MKSKQRHEFINEDYIFESMNPEFSFAILQCVINEKKEEEIADLFHVSIPVIRFWCRLLLLKAPSLNLEDKSCTII